MLGGSGWEVIDDMSLVRPCSRPGCKVLTMGQFCVQHEPPRREALAVRARVDVRTVTGFAVAVRRPHYSPPGGDGQA
jgi:hypothetical protein